MRIIPKKTNVEMEFFKGIGLIDMLILGVGGSLAFSLLLSDLPFHMALFCVTLTVTIAIVIPIDDEKAYEGIFAAMKYLARYRQFVRREEAGTAAADNGKRRRRGKGRRAALEDIIPFTGISDQFIEYGTSYSAVVLEVSPVEFRFYSEERQNNLIDQVLASILRRVTMGETASMVKLDRPIIYDEVIRSEYAKIDALKESYLNGLLSEDELTRRVGIVQDRITRVRQFNETDKIYIPFHYLVLYHKNRELLTEQAENASRLLGSNDMECRLLKGAELAVFLKYNYTQSFDEREVKRLKPEEYMNWILPHEIRFTPRTVIYDGLVTHNLRVTRYPTIVGNAWGHKIFNIPGTRVVMKIKPMDRYKSVKQIDRAIDELREQETRTGKTSKLMELGTHIDTLGEVLRLLQGDNETLFKTDLYLTIYDYEYSNAMAAYTGKKGEPKPVVKRKKEVKRSLSEDNFRTTDMMMQQFEAYTSTSVSANDAMTRQAQAIHSGSVAAAFPYVYKILNDRNGIYIGNSGGVPAFVNFFLRSRDRVNSNMVIIGKSGSGKSYATKTILTHLAAEDSKIFILDPENEYLEMAKNFDGKIIDVGSATQGRLNPFHIITNLSDEEEEENQKENTSFHTHLQFLEEFYRQILPGIEPDALEYLNNITNRMYEEKGIDADTDLSTLSPSDFPVFDDLYEKILNDFQLSTGEYSKKNLRVLLNYISKFATGGRNSGLWNGEASISTKENFIVFNFQSLLANKNNTIANAQMLLVLKWLDNEIIKNRDYNIRYHASRKIIVVIDEAHVFIDSKYPIALDFMFQLAKRIRKYNGMQIVITQNIKDFVGTEELARKSTAIINASQYSFIFPLAPNDMHDLCRLYEKAGAINESEQNDIINNGRGRAFVITSPSERTCVDIVAGEDIERLFTM
ncbi:MAG: ATP-binding protein [Eubacteriales bacterium]|nr:ATP-binding protein [Eubacteriales bacterium]